MTFYDRADRDLASRPKETFEFHLVYAICFVGLLIPTAIRRHNPLSARRSTQPRDSIIGETKSLAANCAATSFMGM